MVDVIELENGKSYTLPGMFVNPQTEDAMNAIMNKALSEYFRVTKFKLDVANYIFRNPAKMFANF